MGIGELLLITVLLSFGGIGLDGKAPAAPAAADVLVWAPDGAQAMGVWHSGATLPSLVGVIRNLRKNKVIKDLPDSGNAVDHLIDSIERGISGAEQTVGVNPLKDLDWVAWWVSVDDADKPVPVAVISGRFNTDLPSRLADAMGLTVTPITMGSARGVSDSSGASMLVTGDRRTVLIGPTDWLKRRLETPGTAKDALSVRAAKLLKEGPYLMVASMPSERVRGVLRGLLERPELRFVRDLLTTHRFFAVSLKKTGIRWDWEGLDERSAHMAEVGSTGIFDLLRAGQHATRGVVRLAMAVLHSYKGHAPIVDWALKHQKVVGEVLLSYSGNGQFSSKVVRKGMLVTASASAKHIDQILPVTGLGMLSALGIWGLTSRADDRDEFKEAPSKTRTKRKVRTRGLPNEVQPQPDQLQPIPTP